MEDKVTSKFSNQSNEEELIRKAHEVILPLDLDNCLLPRPLPRSQPSPNADMKDVMDDEADNVSEQEDDIKSDDEGKPMFNVWKGQNHELHILTFDNEFDKHLKSFQVPKTVPILMDPFCRNDLEYSGNDPTIGEGFLLWEAKKFRQSLNTVKGGESNNNPSNSRSSTHHEQKRLISPILNSSNASSSSDDEDFEHESQAESDVEIEICQYIKSQKVKQKQGLNVAQETLWYDQDYDAIRNFHKESISLTNYGALADQKFFGNTKMLFDQLSSEEKQMLKPVNSLTTTLIEEEQSAICKLKKLGTRNGGGDF